jgi:pyruvate dehydrogenase E2 component (dihydrolipoamide acetyltransferase)
VASSIIMPKTGMAMEEGIILEWRVKEGDKVARGDVVALIETDKSTMELESGHDGVILAIVRQAGETVPVTQVIAWVGQSGEAVPVAEKAAGRFQKGAEISAGVPAGAGAGPLPEAEQTAGPRATPAARALAKERGIDLRSLVPGGRYGEITKAGVQAAMAGARSPAAPLQTAVSPALQAKAGSSRKDTRMALTAIQKIAGKRLSESRQTIPEVTAQIKADVTRMLELRQELNSAMAAAGTPGKITINDFVLAATVKALVDFPQLNSTLDGGELVYKGSINLGMATATDRGLVVPVIHDAEDYSLAGLSLRAAELALRAREGTLKNEEIAGGTFTVSNLGIYGITAFTPIINPPEAAILGVCAVEDELALDGEKVAVRKRMGLSLAYDHRIVDGAESSLFLKALKDYLEAPGQILV